jgi:serine O-acetyltransferase
MLDVIEADLRAHVDVTDHAGASFWLWALGKSLLAPQVHAVFLYRLSHLAYTTPLRPLAFVLRTIAVVWSGAEIHPGARFGPGLALVHSNGVCIGFGVRAGRNCRIHQGVTLGEPGIGRRGRAAGVPAIGDDVMLGAHAVVLGDVVVGDGAVVGANSVVTRDVPANTLVAGAPARVVRQLPPMWSDVTDVDDEPGHAAE